MPNEKYTPPPIFLPAALVRAATSAGARLLDLPGGTSPERPLAFIAVEGNPLEDLAALHRVRVIID